MPVISVKLNDKDLEEIVRTALEKQYDRKVTKFLINVEQGYEDRPCGGSYPRFSNVTVELGDKIKHTHPANWQADSSIKIDR